MTTLTTVTEKPISFTEEMMKALLDGIKTQTRRVVTPDQERCLDLTDEEDREKLLRYANPYGFKGDELWVKEAYQITGYDPPGCAVQVLYTVDGQTRRVGLDEDEIEKFEARKYPYRKSPGRFMYRSLSRVQLTITDIGVEQVQDITEADALADGGWEYKNCPYNKNPIKSFVDLWDSINADRGYGWDQNPYVWAIEFKVKSIKGNEP